MIKNENVFVTSFRYSTRFVFVTCFRYSTRFVFVACFRYSTRFVFGLLQVLYEVWVCVWPA